MKLSEEILMKIKHQNKMNSDLFYLYLSNSSCFCCDVSTTCSVRTNKEMSKYGERS